MKEIRTYSLLISWGFIATFELALICHLLCNLDLIFPKQDQFANLSDHSHPSSADKNHEHKPDTHHLIDFEVNMSHQYYSLNVAEECCDDLSRAL